MAAAAPTRGSGTVAVRAMASSLAGGERPRLSVNRPQGARAALFGGNPSERVKLGSEVHGPRQPALGHSPSTPRAAFIFSRILPFRLSSPSILSGMHISFSLL